MKRPMRRAARPVRALVEPLEPRQLLAAVSWDSGGGDGLWSNPLNWSGDVLPTHADDVTIDWASNRRTIAADAGVIRVRSLTLSELLIVNRGTTLNVNEAFDIAAAGALRINGLVNWVEGTWASDDPVAVNPGGLLNIGSSQQPGSGAVTLDADLNNLGGVSWRGGDIILGGTLTIAQSKVLSVSSPGSMGGPGEIVNHALLRKQGQATTTIGVRVTSDSRVYALQGTLILGAPGQSGASEISGRVYCAEPAAVELRADASFSGVEFIGLGSISFLGGTLAFSGVNTLGPVIRRFEGVQVVVAASGAELAGSLEAIDGVFTLEGDLEIRQVRPWGAAPGVVRLLDSAFEGNGRLTLVSVGNFTDFVLSGVTLDAEADAFGYMSVRALTGSDGGLTLASDRTLHARGEFRIDSGALTIADGATCLYSGYLVVRGGTIEGTAAGRIVSSGFGRLFFGYWDSSTPTTHVLTVTLDIVYEVVVYKDATLDIQGPMVQLPTPAAGELWTLTGGKWTGTGRILFPSPIERIGASAHIFGTFDSIPAMAGITEVHGGLGVLTDGAPVEFDTDSLVIYGQFGVGSTTLTHVVLQTPIEIMEGGELGVGGTLEINAFNPSGVFHNRGHMNIGGTLILNLDQGGGEEMFRNSGQIQFSVANEDPMLIVHGDMVNEGDIAFRFVGGQHPSGTVVVHVDGLLTQGGTMEARLFGTVASYGPAWASIPIYSAAGASGTYSEVRLYRGNSTSPTTSFVGSYLTNGLQIRPNG